MRPPADRPSTRPPCSRARRACRRRPGPRPASGHGIPSSSRAGRRFAHRSSRWRSSRISPQSETWSGTDGSPTAPISTAVVPASDVERVVRHHPPVLVPVGRAPRELRPVEREAERVDRPPGLRHHLRARPRRRGGGRPGSVTRRGRRRRRHALDVVERLLERDDVGVLRLDVEQVRLVRRLRPVADALARHERRLAVLEQVDRGRADAAARRRAAEDHRVDALRDQDRRRGSCRRSRTRPS